jgi:long-subunit fatty acid transport protein
MARIFLSCLAIILCTPWSAGQAGGEVTGDSPRMAAMAGAGLAGGVDLAEAAHNPAMLSFVLANGKAGQVEFYLRGVSNPVVGSDVAGQAFTSSNFTGLGPWMAVGVALPGNFSAGLNLMPTAGGSMSMNRLTLLGFAADETEPGSGEFVAREHWIEIENDIRQLALDPSLAWSPSPGLSFGIGGSFRTTEMDLGSATEFNLDKLAGDAPTFLSGLGDTWGEVLQAFGDLGGRDLSNFQVDYQTELEADLMSFLKLGMAWENDSGTRYSFWYRPPSTRADLSGKVDVDLSADLGDIIDAVFGEDSEKTSQFDLKVRDLRFPQQVGFALMHPATDRDRLHFQAIWTQWSDTFDGWTAELTGGNNEIFNEMLGGDGATEFELDNDWNDSFNLAFGWERDWDSRPAPWAAEPFAAAGRAPESWDFTTRLGLAWASNPVAGSVIPGLMPFNQWHVGGGVSLRHAPFGGNWSLGFVVALPETLQVGENKVLSDLSGDRYQQSNYALMLGYALSW